LLWIVLRVLAFRLAVKQSRILASALGRWTTGLPPDRIYAMVDLATRIPYGQKRCLPRSILLSEMQSWSDAPRSLLIGVALSGNTLESHAWVESSDPAASVERENVERFSVVVRL
jgi:hypothetical protein